MSRKHDLTGARPGSRPPRFLFLSPHPDDIAWSLGATLARLRIAGAQSAVLTFFTRSRYAPGHPAADVAGVTSTRAREERAWAAAAGVRLLRGELEDAGLRGYDDETELGAQPEVDIVHAAAELLLDTITVLAPDALFVPGCTGGHVDHSAVRIAAAQLPPDIPLLYYDDLPYATGSDGAATRHRLVVDIDAYWPAKVAGMRHFASQRWADVLPVVSAHARRVGGEPIATDSYVGARLLRRLTEAA